MQTNPEAKPDCVSLLLTPSIETGFAPSAYHALGWGPVQTSAVLGSISVVILCMMLVVFELSKHKVRDEDIMLIGLVLSMVGYTLIWSLWDTAAAPWQFIVPIILSASAFPFLAAPTRSLFTKAVDNIAILEGHQGTMQALLSMAASVAGFTAPSFVAAFVLRHPSELKSTSRQRVLSDASLFAPVLSGIVLLGLMLVRLKNSSSSETQTDSHVDEETELLATKQGSKRRFSHRDELHRRDSTKLMGISQPNTHREHHEHYHIEES